MHATAEPPTPSSVLRLRALARVCAIGLAVGTATVPACKCSRSEPRPDTGADGLDDDEPVQPVYPLTDLPANPLAQRLCDALHTGPSARRAQCCGWSTPGYSVTGECVRTLSAALASKAVTLAPDEVDRCVAAVGKLYEGCGWVGPWSPTTPPECTSMIQGQLAEGVKCRSSLECSGTLRCRGVGPTDPGVCGKPRAAGAECSAGVDSLAAYTRHDRLEETHPECVGYCARYHCTPFVALGEKCGANVQCGPENRCAGDKCVAGPVARLGEACADTGCEAGSRCYARVCTKPKPAGEACSSDTECAAACVKDDAGAAGVCGMRCQ